MVAVQVLKNAISKDRISSAILLHGHYGVGKTSVARIISKSVNCRMRNSSSEPCNKCKNCDLIKKGIHPDIIEIDAASNTSVENIKQLVDNSRYLPTIAQYKIYIIDEVHMLSNSAFNALLKTLEEPLPHIKFILATTHKNKIPSTIISRCQHFHLTRLNSQDIISILTQVTTQENIVCESKALHLIAKNTKGSVRDAISILEQTYLYNEIITENNVYKILGLNSEDNVDELTHKILNNSEPKEVLSLFRELIHSYDPVVILEQVLDSLYKYISSNPQDSKTNHIHIIWNTILHDLQLLKYAPSIHNASEMIILKASLITSLPTPENIISDFYSSQKKNL
ncbi:MAG: DNA polymerase III, subunits gamma and tau [Candidatus Xenolissoclinum pacificiensis L6]|uniref:DNA polymerase III subunit gamma/tau n=1 Tax=Candidatus Xenolissoclinum pacificiensis L6 TaxID=1401685 RepID=W2V338_9RICK|nr:MAG: DNA polymerase III, subunits gamma and tau [Candidatus Xenolissoclinum pacificiensis L6]